MRKKQKNFKYEKGCNEEGLEKPKKVDEAKNLKGKILVSQFAYQKAQEKKELLEKDITENVIESNRDYPESDVAFLAANQLKVLKKVMESFFCVERRESEKNVIQLGDTIVLKHKKNEIIRIVDGYQYNTKVCPLLIHLIGKGRGDKITVGNMSNVEILDFYPPK